MNIVGVFHRDINVAWGIPELVECVVRQSVQVREKEGTLNTRNAGESDGGSYSAVLWH